VIKLSKLTDYAVIVLGCLSRQQGKPVSASYVAGETLLPEPTVRKVLKMMATRKLITAQRGVNGGYILPLALGCISVYDVVEAIEGSLELAPCLHDSSEICALSRVYAVKGRWNRVNLAIKHTLDNIRISDLLVENGKRAERVN